LLKPNGSPSGGNWGIRSFYLYINKCPSFCKFCDVNSVKANTCGIYELISSSWLTNTGLNNDGWTITGISKSATANTTTCGPVALFGGYNTFAVGTKL
jgi:hypothetical protein